MENIWLFLVGIVVFLSISSGSYAAHSLDGQRQRSNIQQKDIACAGIACQLTALDRSTDGHALIRVQGLAGLMAGQLFYLLLYSRNTGGTAYQQYLATAQKQSVPHLSMRSVPGSAVLSTRS